MRQWLKLLSHLPFLGYLIVSSFFATDALSKSPSPPPTGVLINYTSPQLLDEELHDALAANFSQVTVDPITPFTVSELPVPIMKWLSAVRAKGGGYTFVNDATAAESQNESADLASLLFEITKELWRHIKELIMYSPAENYRAVIHYRSRKDLSVSKIIFKRLEY